VAFAAVLLLLLPSAVPTPSPWNTSAEAVAQGSRALGVEFRQAKDAEGGPSRETNQALSRAGVGTWLDSQIEVESAEIGEPPAALREYMLQNRDALWAVVAALERDEPEWGPAFGENGYLQLPFLPVLRLERVLVAAALVEEREDRSIEASRALDAAWSLARSVSSPDNLISLLIRIGAERMQVGALRKLRRPPLQWLGRLSSDGPWTRLPDTLREEPKLRPRRASQDPAQEMFAEVAEKMYAAVGDSLEKLSPCDPVLASDLAIWTPAVEALAAETNASKRAIRDFYKENSGELIGNVVRRAARLEVDREMTLKILQLRLEKESSGDGRWPEKTDTTSAVCPEASYSYESTSDAMTLRFLGTVEAPKGFLPLAFRAAPKAPRSPDAETPTPTPALTPTPTGGMIAPP
jgi:hypothetical protein